MPEPTCLCGAGEGRSRRSRSSGGSDSLVGWDPAVWRQIIIPESTSNDRRTALEGTDAIPTFLFYFFKTQLEFAHFFAQPSEGQSCCQSGLFHGTFPAFLASEGVMEQKFSALPGRAELTFCFTGIQSSLDVVEAGFVAFLGGSVGSTEHPSRAARPWLPRVRRCWVLADPSPRFALTSALR